MRFIFLKNKYMRYLIVIFFLSTSPVHSQEKLTYKCGTTVDITEPMNQCLSSYSKYENQKLAKEICDCLVRRVASKVTLEDWTNDNAVAINFAQNKTDIANSFIQKEYFISAGEECFIENPSFSEIYGKPNEERIKEYARTNLLAFKNGMSKQDYNELLKTYNIDVAFECMIRKLYSEFTHAEMMEGNEKVYSRSEEIMSICFLENIKSPTIKGDEIALNKDTKKVDKEVEVRNAEIEIVPIFPGCELGSNADKRKCMYSKIIKFIQSNFNTFPDKNLFSPGKQSIKVDFDIDKNGYITNISAEAPHPILEQEAIRVIKMLPRMKPGIQRGKPVIVPYKVPISFVVEDDISTEKLNSVPPPPPPSSIAKVSSDFKVIIREFNKVVIDSVLTKRYGGVKTYKDVSVKDTIGYFYKNGLTNKNYKVYETQINSLAESLGYDKGLLTHTKIKGFGKDLYKSVMLIKSKSYNKAYEILQELQIKLYLFKENNQFTHYPFESGVNYWLGVYYEDLKMIKKSKNYFKAAYNLEPNRLTKP